MKQITSSEELGALIHSMRKSQKITQEKLAAYSGVGIRFIGVFGDAKRPRHRKRHGQLQAQSLRLFAD